MDETKTTTCPHRARTIIPYTASNRGSVISILRRLPGKSLQFCISGFRFSNPQSRTQHFSLDRWWMFTCFAISPEEGPLSLIANNDYFPNGCLPVYNTTWMRLSPPYWLLMITSPMDVHLFCNTTWISAGAGPDFWLRSQLLQSNGIAIFQRVTNQDQYTSTNNDRIFTFESMDVSWSVLCFVIV